MRIAGFPAAAEMDLSTIDGTVLVPKPIASGDRALGP
jgi:hypothetical protein